MLRGVWKDPVFFTFPLGGVWLSKHQSLRRSWMSPWKENPGCFGLFFFLFLHSKNTTTTNKTRWTWIWLQRFWGIFYLYLTKWKNAVWLAPIFQVPKGRGEQNWGCCRQGWPCASTRISTTFSAPWWLSSSWLLGKPIFFRKILCPKYTHVLHVWNIYLHLALNYGNTWSIWDSIKPF